MDLILIFTALILLIINLILVIFIFKRKTPNQDNDQSLRNEVNSLKIHLANHSV